MSAGEITTLPKFFKKRKGFTLKKNLVSKMLKGQADLALLFDAAVSQNSWQSQTSWSETHEASVNKEHTATK